MMPTATSEQPQVDEIRHQRLLEATNVIPWEADAQTWVFTYVGPQVETLLGYPPEQWYEKDFWISHIHPEDRSFAIKFCESSSKTLTDFEFEYRMIAADGRTVWLSDVVNVVTESGTPRVLRGFMKDITKRKRDEETLRESQEQLDLVLEATNSGLWDWNIKTGEVFYSSRWKESLGYSAEEVPPHVSFWESLVHPDDMPGLKISLQRHLDGETASYGNESRLRMKNGEYRWILDKGKVVQWDADGKPSRIVGIDIDITEFKQAEEALQESRALLDSYFAVAPVGMALFDAEMRYVTLNGTLAEINGLSIEDHLHKRPRDILPGELGAAVEEKFAQLLRTGQSIITEEISGETLSQPGVTRHWLHSYFPIFGLDETPKGIGVTLIEITDIKTVEEQLRQSQKMEALGTLSGGIAHDFNNILYPIFIYANLLLDKFAADSDEYTDLTEIIGAAHRAKDLVSQILVFGRRSDNVKSVCDLVPVAEEALKLVRAALPATITIEEKMHDDIVPVCCDSSQIYLVLVNICTNAGQAISDHGRIEVDLEATEIDGIECFDGIRLSGSHARLAVTDNGVGMDKETLAKIFDPFFTTREVGQGTGLGLSTAFGIVQDHGGGITVSSTPGKGTTFEIFLPLSNSSDIEKLPANPDRAQDNTGTEKILFVDDEEAIRNLGKDYLERFGYNVTTVADGQEALELFRAGPDRFNLVVSDQTMPKMTGEELARELLQLRPAIPVIICTGYSSSISPESSSAIGISALLHKPLTPDELSRVVRDVLDQAKKTGEGE